MLRLNQKAKCPGYAFFNLKKLVHERDNKDGDVKDVSYSITLSAKVCNLCQCAIVRKVTNKEFSVKCSWDELERELKADPEYYRNELEIWKLRLGVLQDEVSELTAREIIGERRERMGG